MQVTRSRPAAPAPDGNGRAPAPPRRSRGRLRRAGVLAGRLLLWAAILLLAARGAVVTVTELGSPAVPAAPAGSVGVDPAFPEDAARAFATRFAHDYLTYDDEGDRSGRLAAYAPGGLPGDLGWNGVGTQTVRTAVAVGVDVVDPGRAAVVVAAQVAGPRWLHLSVPVLADGAGRLALDGSPTLVSAPPLAAVPPAPEVPVDTALGRTLAPVIESFFGAYAAGRADDLDYYLTVGRTIDGLDGAVELDELVDLRVAEGGDTRHALATVRWRDEVTGAALTQRYDLRLVDGGGRWYVDALGAAAAQSDAATDTDGRGGRDDR